MKESDSEVEGWTVTRVLTKCRGMFARALQTAGQRPAVFLGGRQKKTISWLEEKYRMMRAETEFKDIPVIFLTGRDDRESVMKAKALRQ